MAKVALLCLVAAVCAATPFTVTTPWCGDNAAGGCTGSTYSNIFEQQVAGQYMFVTSLSPHKVSRFDPVADSFNAGFVGSGSASNAEGVGAAASVHYPLGLTSSLDGSILFVGRACGISRVYVNTAELKFHAGHPTQWGHADGLGHNARFEYILSGLAIPTSGRGALLEQIVVVDRLSHVIRQVDKGHGAQGVHGPPETRYVATVCGSPGVSGSQDGVGSAARFYLPTLVRTAGSYAYIFESGNQQVRKMQLITIVGSAGSASVSTVFSTGFEAAIEVSNDGSTIWYASETAVYGYNVASSGSTLVAGAAATGGFVDGVGANARFSALWSMRRFTKSSSLETLIIGANGRLRELTLA